MVVVNVAFGVSDSCCWWLLFRLLCPVKKVCCGGWEAAAIRGGPRLGRISRYIPTGMDAAILGSDGARGAGSMTGRACVDAAEAKLPEAEARRVYCCSVTGGDGVGTRCWCCCLGCIGTGVRHRMACDLSVLGMRKYCSSVTVACGFSD